MKTEGRNAVIELLKTDKTIDKLLLEKGAQGSLGLIETFSAASAIKAADIAVKTARVAIFDLRVSRGMGGKGVIMLTGEVGDVTAAVEAGANYAITSGQLSSTSVIAAPHADLWNQL